MSRLPIPAAPRVRLLGPDGRPIHRAEVPFIQWLPDGTSTGRAIERSDMIAALAATFISKGGRYAMVWRVDNNAELVAGFVLDDSAKGEMLAIAEEVVPNGPEIGPAVDRLVLASVANLHKYTFTESA
jgi:hypothetical protein